jgi:hypothetical protein
MGTWLETTQRRWRSNSRKLALRERLWSRNTPLDAAPDDFTPWIKPYCCLTKDFPTQAQHGMSVPRKNSSKQVLRKLLIPKTAHHKFSPSISPHSPSPPTSSVRLSNPYHSLPASPLHSQAEKTRPVPSFTYFDVTVIPAKPAKLLSLEQLRSYVRLRSQPKFR